MWDMHLARNMGLRVPLLLSQLKLRIALRKVQRWLLNLWGLYRLSLDGLHLLLMVWYVDSWSVLGLVLRSTLVYLDLLNRLDNGLCRNVDLCRRRRMVGG